MQLHQRDDEGEGKVRIAAASLPSRLDAGVVVELHPILSYARKLAKEKAF